MHINLNISDLNFETKEENDAYLEGLKHGILMYAKWKNGR